MQLHPAQRGADARRQLLGHHRLGDVVVGACLQTGHQVVRVGLRGDDDDRDDARRAQGTTHLEAADVGQAQVEQHQVRLVVGERFETGPSISRLAHLVALVLQRESQGEPDRVVVLDEQQRCHLGILTETARRAHTNDFCYSNRTISVRLRHSRRSDCISFTLLR